MRANDTQNELFDVLLKKAFLESSEKEIAGYEKEAEKYAAVTPTEKQKKQARRAYRRANPRKSTAATRIATSVVLALCLGAASILAVPSVRANLFDSFMEFYDNHVTFKRSDAVELQGFLMYYLPEGYHLEKAVEVRPFCQYFFTNEEGEKMILKYMLTSSSKIDVDNEHYDIERKNLFGDVMGYTMVPRDPDISTNIMWERGEHTFMLDGHMSVRELVRIARCIVPVEEAETQTP